MGSTQTTDKENAKYIFLSSTLDAAVGGAELAFGVGKERIYLVEPTGEIEDGSDLTDRKFPGNPTNPIVRQNRLELLEKLRFGKDTRLNKLNQ